MQRFTIVGSGNIASWFAWLINRHGGKIVQVFSRELHHAEELALSYHAEPIDRLSQLNPNSDLYIFTVKDDAYAELIRELPFELPFAVHTAGSISQEIFKEYAQHYGVLYPYQSISKGMDFDTLEVPLCVEGGDDESEKILIQLLQNWNINYRIIHEEQRAVLHLAAAFASNFTNALYAIAWNLLQEKNIDERIIFPLLNNTLEKAKQISPSKAQTGPAIRKDEKTMHKHLEMLCDEELRDLYRLLSKQIQTITTKDEK